MKRLIWCTAILFNLVLFSNVLAFPEITGTYTGTLVVTDENKATVNALIVIEFNKHIRNVLGGTITFFGKDATFTGTLSRSSFQAIVDSGSINGIIVDNNTATIYISVEWNESGNWYAGKGSITKISDCTK